MRSVPVQDNRSRLIAKVLRDVLAHATFETVADLKDVLWRRLHQLHIDVTPLEVDDALTLVGSNAVMTDADRAPNTPPPTPDRLLNEPPLITREHAAWILDRIRQHAVTTAGPRVMPFASPQRDLANARRRRELQVVAQAMAITATHVSEPEDQLEEERMRDDQNLGTPCSCLECQAAGVTDRPIVKVPPDEFIHVPHWLHGEPLKRWWATRDAFLAQIRSPKESR